MLITGLIVVVISSCENKKSNVSEVDSPTHRLDSQGADVKYDSATVKDIDGNIYHTITIGSQVWMAENLRVTHFNNGEPIPNVTDDIQWSKLSTGAYCNYNNDPTAVRTYGRLYNWYAINDARKIAPPGWHIPSAQEWQQLVESLGGSQVAGALLKEPGTSHWDAPNKATNRSRFTALPAGERNNDGTFLNLGFSAGWWTVTTESAEVDFASNVGVTCNTANVSPDLDARTFGLSVRCLRNAE